MTTDRSAGDGVGEADRSMFGRNLAARVRLQRSSLPRWRTRPLLGAVGRASLGFGRAVGRSQGIRPVVGLADVNSTTLRPPSGAWLPELDMGSDPGSDMDTTVGPAVARRRRAIQRSSATMSVQRTTPTWTDKLLADQVASSGRRTAHTTTGSGTAPAVADETFVSSGDAKLDDLRRMFAAGELPKTPGEAPRRPARTALPATSTSTSLQPSPSPRPAAVTVHGERDVGSAVRGGTAAGPGTAPGRLAGRLVPEVVDNVAASSSRAGAARRIPQQDQESAQRPASRTDRSSEAADRPAPAQRGRSSDIVARSIDRAAAARSASGRSRPGRDQAARSRTGRNSADVPSRLDILRDFLEQRGELPPSDPPGTAPDDTDARPRRGPEPADRSRPAPLGDESASNSERPQIDTDPAHQPAYGPPGGDRAHGADRVGGDARVSSIAPPASRSVGAAAPDGTSSADEFGAVAVAERTSVTSDRRLQRLIGRTPLLPDVDRATSGPDTDVADEGTAGSATIDADRFETVLSPPVAGRPADGRTRHDVDGRLSDDHTAARPTSTTSTLGSAVPRRASFDIRPLPRLDGDVLRRVTLPRTLSTVHRPDSPGSRSAEALMYVESGAAPPTAPGAGTLAVDGSLGARADTAVSDRAPVATPTPLRSVPSASTIQRTAVARPAASPTAAAHAVPATSGRQDRTRRSSVRQGVGALSTVLRSMTASEATELQPDMTTPRPPMAAVSDGAPEQAVETPAEQLAARFLGELSATIRRRPAPLPTTFQPMADAITGGRGVLLSTDTASRRALRRVGKVAATTDNVIHLDRSLAPGPRTNEVIAHELTHIAHPSPAPRFFDDLDDSPEERQAESVARVMARSPLAPTASTVTPATGARSGSRPAVIRRSAAPAAQVAQPTTEPGTVDAASMAARLTKSEGTARPVIQRFANPPAASGPSGGALQSAAGAADASGAASLASMLSGSTDADDWFVDQLDKHFDRLVRSLGDRMARDLERRGGRRWGAL